MNISDFSTYVMNELDLFMPDFPRADYRIVDINKSDGTATKALIFKGEDAEVMPYLDLMPYYTKWSYDKNIRLEDIIKEIGEDYIFYMNPSNINSHVLGYEFDYDRHKYYIVPEIDNYARNAEWIDKLPHTMIDDMAVTYHVVINPASQDERKSFPVTNMLLNKWNLSVEEMHKLAVANIPELLPLNFKEMTEVLSEIYVPLLREGKAVTEIEAKVMVKTDIMPRYYSGFSVGDMYLFSSLNGEYGATTMLYEQYQHMLSGLVGGDYYVIPSSPHEVLIVPDKGQDPELLASVMKQAVDTLVPDGIYALSDNIYFYNGDSKHLEVSVSLSDLENKMDVYVNEAHSRDDDVSIDAEDMQKHPDPSLVDEPALTGTYSRPISRFRL